MLGRLIRDPWRAKVRKLAAITISAVVALGILGFLGWRLLIRSFTDRYYREAYAPDELTEGQVGAYPAEHHLADVP